MTTTLNGTYTAGCLDGRTLLKQEPVDKAYRQDDGHFTRSYAHSVFKGGGPAQECLDNGESLFDGNPSTTFGTLVDRAIPAVICGVDLAGMYAVPPEDVLSNGARRGNAYLKWKESLVGLMEITADDWERLQRIVANCLAHPRVREIFEATEDCQAVLRHTDASGHRRKCMTDGVTKEFLWDFKTTSSSWGELGKSFFNFGYLWQDAWYEQAAVACGWEPHRLRFIVAQSMKPYAVRVYTNPEEMVDRARVDIARTLDQIALRRKLNYYRSVEDEEEVVLDYPAWIRRQGDEAHEY